MRDSRGYGLFYACVRCFLRKDATLIGVKILIKKIIDNIGLIKRLPGSGRPQRINTHFSLRSYLIILLTEVRDML